MSKKKSLGSSPIGYNINSTNYSFIRDIGVADKSSADAESHARPSEEARITPLNPHEKSDKYDDLINQIEKEKQSTEKKVASYYLEVQLIERLKNLADEKEEYYSSVVSRALEAWIELHGY